LETFFRRSAAGNSSLLDYIEIKINELQVEGAIGVIDLSPLILKAIPTILEIKISKTDEIKNVKDLLTPGSHNLRMQLLIILCDRVSI
jgi:hypothetical protein